MSGRNQANCRLLWHIQMSSAMTQEKKWEKIKGGRKRRKNLGTGQFSNSPFDIPQKHLILRPITKWSLLFYVCFIPPLLPSTRWRRRVAVNNGRSRAPRQQTNHRNHGNHSRQNWCSITMWKRTWPCFVSRLIGVFLLSFFPLLGFRPMLSQTRAIASVYITRVPTWWSLRDVIGADTQTPGAAMPGRPFNRFTKRGH